MRAGSPDARPATPKASEDRGVAPVLVLAVGNVLLGDDGFGQQLLRRIEALRARWGSSVDMVDGGTQGLALLGLIAGRRGLLVLDAVKLGAAAGTVHQLRNQEVFEAASHRGLTAHEGSAPELLRAAALLGDLPPEIVVLGVEPASLETGVGLSPAARGALEDATAFAAKVLDDLVAKVGNPRAQG